MTVTLEGVDASKSSRLEVGRMVYTALILANSGSEALASAESEYPESYTLDYEIENGSVSPANSAWMNEIVRRSNQADRERIKRHWSARWDAPKSSLWVVQLTLVKYQTFTLTEEPTGAGSGEGDASEAGEDRPEMASDRPGQSG